MTIDALDLGLLRHLAIALFIGALVGVDRERKAIDGIRTFGGLRTFMLISLTGAVAAWLGGLLGQPWLLPIGLIGLSALLAVSYHAAQQEPAPGLTSEVAAIVVYLLGAVCTAGHPEIAVAIGITTSALLTFRTSLHDLARQIGPDDLAAGLKLLFSTFIVLPLLPDQPVDPLGVLVPYRLWWLVVLISGLSLLGYGAVRWLGEQRGLFLTGLFGGLVSSTAVTMASARQSREEGAATDALAMSVLAAWAVMFVRVVVEVAFVQPSMTARVAPPMLAMAAATALAAGFFGMRPHPNPRRAQVTLRNPFSLWEATKFALMFAAVLVAVELAHRFVDERALYGIAALAGTTDVDAITLSMAEAAGREVDVGLATRAIVVASVSNTVVKTGITAAWGSRALALRIAGAAAVAGLAGAVVAVLWS
ncbi:MAG: MgtC/SapB family protein [Alphaproteobacteria bacterium]|nr:MgtC/SapB family protein [Alphaproteobacteria bacterium]MCB9698596.1 MgtC/SapB family protein [Alphaproteobacteria bacterium]